MKNILTAECIEFGTFVVGTDQYPMALVKGEYEVDEVSEADVEEFLGANGDYIDLDVYVGEVIIVGERR
jgi:hypothetical protein